MFGRVCGLHCLVAAKLCEGLFLLYKEMTQLCTAGLLTTVCVCHVTI